MGRVEGKVCIVTGGSSGIGKACALTLGREGAFVVVTDIDDIGGEAVQDEIVSAGGRAKYLHHDVASEDEWADVIAATVSEFGQLDVLVNNAGIAIGGPIVDTTLDEWRRLMSINLDGVFLGTKHAIPTMAASGGGSIIIMSSLAGLKGSPGLVAYNASKGGVRLFAKGAALECAAGGLNVRVNSVHPGIIETPIWDKIEGISGPVPGGPEISEGANRINIEEVIERAVPVGVVGQAQDIANGVLYLASDESSYVTGSELVIDGGMFAS